MAKARKEKSAGFPGSLFASLLDARCPNCGTRTAWTLFWRCRTCGYPSRSNIRCPNCGLTTNRTRDWACERCGYPLTSSLYKKVDGDFRQAWNESREQIRKEEQIVAPLPFTPEKIPVVAQAVGPPPAPIAPSGPSVSELPEPPPPEAHTLPPSETAPRQPPVTPLPEPETTQAAFPTPVPPLSDEIIDTTTEDLCGDFQNDAVLADRKYAGRMLKVKGTIEVVTPGEGEANPQITLASADTAAQKRVQCAFAERYRAVVGRMNAGQKVAVLGRYDGCDGDIRLADCMPVG